MRKPIIAALAVAFLSLLPATGSSAAVKDTTNVSLATFEGKTIDLRKGWGDAGACAVIGGHATCFRSQAQMNEWLDTRQSVQALTGTCTSSVVLFEHTGYQGAVLYLSGEGEWLNLPDYGFNDRTSSYFIGACDSLFAEHIDGNGSWYPGATYAWAYASSMAWGWNDRISSVWIA